MNLVGVSNGLRAEGLFEAVNAAVSEETRAALADPRTKKWHPSRVALDIQGAIIRLASTDKLSDVYFRMTRDAFGPVMGPLIKVALALGGSNPATLFGKLGTLLKVSAQGVASTFTSTGKNSGTVTLDYVCDMPAVPVEHSWRGILRYGDLVVNEKIRILRFEVVTPRQFVFSVEWS